jgi:hypothetical protein
MYKATRAHQIRVGDTVEGLGRVEYVSETGPLLRAGFGFARNVEIQYASAPGSVHCIRGDRTLMVANT